MAVPADVWIPLETADRVRVLGRLADGATFAEAERVLFGFWRGQRLTEIEPRLKKGGKYEMATLAFREGTAIAPATVLQLVKEAVGLNGTLGDPTRAAGPAAKGRTGLKGKAS